MTVSRVLLISLLIAMSCVSVAAQSLSENGPVLQLLRTRPQDTHSGIRVDQLQLSPQPGGVNPWHIIPEPELRRPILTNDTTCYSLRTYRVTRDDPVSDSTELTAYSTCQPATGFRVKGAGDSPVQKGVR
jgi:hypothetical protein